jgi:hypothetical protein
VWFHNAPDYIEFGCWMFVVSGLTSGGYFMEAVDKSIEFWLGRGLIEKFECGFFRQVDG